MITPVTFAIDQNDSLSDIQFCGSGQFAIKLNKIDKVCNIWLSGEIYYNVQSYSRLMSLLVSLSEDYIVYMNINSPGGAISTACNIIAAMQQCKAKIITRNMGLAASCGSLILAFGSEIEICHNAITMFHSSATGYNFEVSQRILNKTDHLVKYTEYLLTLIQKKGLITQEEFDGIINNTFEYYIPANDMVDRITKAGILYRGDR